MAEQDKGRPPSERPVQSDLAAAASARLERDTRLPMRDRLARMHELCKQMTTVSGAARRR